MIVRLQLTMLGLLIIHAVAGQHVRMSYTFNTPTFTERSDGFYEPHMEDCLNLAEEGRPLLPAFSAQILIPQGKEVAGVNILSITYGEQRDGISIVPAARQFPFSEPAPDDYQAPPDQHIYSTAKSYPAEIIADISTQFLAGHSIAVFTIRPMQFNPAEKSVRYIKHIELEIEVKNTDRKVVEPAFQSDITMQRLQAVVHNPEQAESYHFSPEKNTDPIDMLIITRGSFVTAFSAYADYKTERGFIVEMVTTEDIYSAYSGADEQEKIRNCIIYYYENHGITHVILGGDSDTQNASQRIVPHRGFHVDTGFGYSDNDIPSDMYYACLDGTWDDNNNGLFGEPGEEDLFAEVLIGRMCIDSNAEVANMVNKLIMYQDSPVLADIEKALMIGESLDASTWGGTYKDEVAHGSSNHGYTTAGITENFNINKLYEMSGNWNKNHVFQQFNTHGINLLNHLGHSSVNYNMKMYTNDLTLANFQNNGINRGFVVGYSQGCYNGSFDNRGSSGNYSNNDCFAERITTMETAMVAKIANSRYGWYMQNSTNGASQYFDRKFYNAIFEKEIAEIGAANGDSKEDNVSFILNNQVIRWCAYELTLFGDPSMHIWTTMPAEIIASYPGAVPVGIASLMIETDAPNARIGLTQDGQLLGRGFTDDFGNIDLALFETITNNAPLTLSITAHNRLVYTGVIPVLTDQAYVIVDDFVINDVNGNNNGIPEFGEELLIGLSMKNLGNQPAGNVIVSLSSADDYISIAQQEVNFGAIDSGATIFIADAFTATISDNVPDQRQITVQVQATDGDTWNSTFKITANAPNLVISSLTIDDQEHGNGNSLLDPDELVTLIFEVNNFGNALSPEITMQLSSGNTNLTLIASEDSIEGLEAGAGGTLSFAAQVDPETVMGDLATLQADLTSGAYELTKNYDLEIGMIVEMFTSGDFSMLNWEFDGNQPWTICDVDPLHGAFSAKSGNIGHNQTSELKVSVFVAQADTISFYRKVSSQAANDYLRFYDGPMLRGEWSGIEPWEKISIAVYPGYRTFRWVYEKDQSISHGDDCAWIDYIRFPRLLLSNLSAGFDDMVCEGDAYQTKSSGVYVININWTTTGSGTFNNPGILQPIYTPSPEDIAAGSVVLSVTATGAGNNILTDSMTLSIVNEPETPALPTGETEVCTNYGLEYEYAVGVAPHTLTYIWELIPPEAGTLDEKGNVVSILWTPDYTGEVELRVKASNDCGDSEFSESLSISAQICTGIEETGGQEISIFPNPTGGLLFIHLPGMGSELELSVYNAAGVIIKQKLIHPDSDPIRIDLQHHPAGIYLLKVSGGNVDFSRKVIVK